MRELWSIMPAKWNKASHFEHIVRYRTPSWNRAGILIVDAAVQTIPTPTPLLALWALAILAVTDLRAVG